MYSYQNGGIESAKIGALTHVISRPKTVFSIPCLLLCIIYTPSSLGASAVDVTPYVGYSIIYEDNVLGLPELGSFAPFAPSIDRSDFSRRTEMGGLLTYNVDKQRFIADLKFNQTRYDNLKELNFNGRNLAGNWNWSITNNLSGNLGATSVKDLAPFLDTYQLARNTRTQSTEYFDAALSVSRYFRLKTKWLNYHTSYDFPARQFANRNEEKIDLGFDYLGGANNAVGLVFSHTDGEFPNSNNDNNNLIRPLKFRQEEMKLSMEWDLTGKTHLQITAGQISRKNLDERVKNFSGINARVTANWVPTSKLSLGASLWRELRSADEYGAAYSLNEGVSVNPRWKISEKVSLDAQMSYERRDFANATKILSQASEYNDVLKNLALGLNYEPFPRLFLRTSLYQSRKSLNVQSSKYLKHGVLLTARKEF